MTLRSVFPLSRAFLIAGALCLLPAVANAQALLLVDTDSGRVLHAEHAGQPWYPASITKVMTTYVTLQAIKAGRFTPDSLIPVSPRAAAQQPSKMGFPVGTRMSIDNALKMLMVRSANDVAVAVAEGVAGSVEAFADEMNQASARLGMTQSHWVNPHGLPDDRQISSARDIAILARAIMKEFPQHKVYWSAPAIQFGRRVFRNYNRLIARYPGADGMKTGFICASGFNLVATATRNNRRLIAVVLGSPSGTQRAETAAQLLERGFSGGALAWLMPSLGTLDAVKPIAADPPNLREDICGGRNRGKTRTDHAEEESTPSGLTAFASTVPGFQPGGEQGSLLGAPIDTAPPIRVTIVAPPRAAPSQATPTPPPRPRSGKAKARKSAVIKRGKARPGKKARRR